MIEHGGQYTAARPRVLLWAERLRAWGLKRGTHRGLGTLPMNNFEKITCNIWICGFWCISTDIKSFRLYLYGNGVTSLPVWCLRILTHPHPPKKFHETFRTVALVHLTILTAIKSLVLADVWIYSAAVMESYSKCRGFVKIPSVASEASWGEVNPIRRVALPPQLMNM